MTSILTTSLPVSKDAVKVLYILHRQTVHSKLRNQAGVQKLEKKVANFTDGYSTVAYCKKIRE